MVACKTVGEYRRNQIKIKKFCIEEARKAKQNSAPVPTRSHSTTTTTQELSGPSRMITKQEKAKQAALFIIRLHTETTNSDIGRGDKQVSPHL